MYHLCKTYLLLIEDFIASFFVFLFYSVTFVKLSTNPILPLRRKVRVAARIFRLSLSTASPPSCRHNPSPQQQQTRIKPELIIQP